MSVYRNFGREGGDSPSYVSASISWKHGQNLSMGFFRMEAGQGSEPHYHNDEQFIYILKGGLRVAVGGEISDAPPGSLVHFAPGAVHELAAPDGEAAEFLLSRGPARERPEEDAIKPEGEAGKSVLR
jgi:quercetin dioxygenase-like cupin family protein